MRWTEIPWIVLCGEFASRPRQSRCRRSRLAGVLSRPALAQSLLWMMSGERPSEPRKASFSLMRRPRITGAAAVRSPGCRLSDELLGLDLVRDVRSSCGACDHRTHGSRVERACRCGRLGATALDGCVVGCAAQRVNGRVQVGVRRNVSCPSWRMASSMAAGWYRTPRC